MKHISTPKRHWADEAEASWYSLLVSVAHVVRLDLVIPRVMRQDGRIVACGISDAYQAT